MAIETANALAAAFKVTASGPTIVGSGIGSLTKNGTGDWTIVLTPKLAPRSTAALVTAKGTTPAICSSAIESLTGGAINVKTVDAAGAAVDTDFDALLVSIP